MTVNGSAISCPYFSLYPLALVMITWNRLAIGQSTCNGWRKDDTASFVDVVVVVTIGGLTRNTGKQGKVQ